MKRLHLKRATARNSGFTLVEVLAALLLIGIVLPAILHAVALSQQTGSAARRRTEAASLAESKLNEIVATNQWQDAGNLSGDFSPDWPGYKWTATTQTWAQDTTTSNIQQLDLTVTWTARSKEDSLTLSTLVYTRSTQ